MPSDIRPGMRVRVTIAALTQALGEASDGQ